MSADLNPDHWASTVMRCPVCGALALDGGGERYCGATSDCVTDRTGYFTKTTMTRIEVVPASERDWLLARATRDSADNLKLDAENERLREALIPFAFAARASLERLGLALERDHARALLGIGPHHDVFPNPVRGGWGGYQPTCRDCGWVGATVPKKDDARSAAVAHRDRSGANDEIDLTTEKGT